jgi:hypothetical protein
MKILIILLAFLSFSCKPAEDRIKDHSYTKEWYYQNVQRYQVYQTKYGERYILVLNNRESKYIRKYLK